ncbi:FAD-binding domain-containing protein [Aspergillus californicus]
MTTTDSTLAKLAEFIGLHPDIQYVTSASPDFDTVRSIFAHPEVIPSAIIRPATAQQVGTVVSFLAENKVEFTIRSGGHDMHGRSMKTGTVAIDMRRIDHVSIDKESSTARVGGGAIFGDVVPALEAEGLITPVGTISAVGYVGWAMYGGYGPYSSQFGLGVDQIVGARIVNARGEVVEADAELLKAIRGAGGAFGVIVEVTIKVYESGQILAGVIVFNSEDLPSVIRQFNEGYRGLDPESLPPALNVQQAVLNMPTPIFGALFTWGSADFEKGKQWLEKVSSLAPSVANTVHPATPQAWLEEADKMVAQSTQGRLWTISLRKVTDEIAQVIGKYAASFPADPHVLFSIHELRKSTPSAQPSTGSVFSVREPHCVFEICTIVDNKELLESALAWGREFQAALEKTSADNIVPASYLSFIAPGDFDQAKVFGQNVSFLRALKERVDPGNVFKAISYL